MTILTTVTSTKFMSLSIFVLGVLVKAFIPRYSKYVSHNRSKSQVQSYQITSKQDSNTNLLNTSNIIKCQEESYALYQRLRACSDSYLAPAIHSSLDVLADALRLYGPTRLISSFNGGKDAVVVMHLLRAAIAKYSYDKSKLSENKEITTIESIIRPQFIYFAIKNEFLEVLDFIHSCEEKYCLNLISYDCGIIQGLERYVKSLNEPNPTVAFVLGTRIGDTNAAGQDIFCPSSAWMPVPFMRVNPILKWEYGQVWKFLKEFELSYCSLYDKGYTSLGKTTDTLPNPYLRRKSLGNGISNISNNNNSKNNIFDENYWPAYMLADWSKERAGRVFTSNESLLVTPSTSIKRNPSISLPSQLDGLMLESLQTSAPRLISATTAGMIVIGDEILDGSVMETNMQVAAKLLGSTGICLKKVSIVSDDVQEIADEVLNFSQKFDVVITSGGVGPTHDDVTIKGVATAFRQELVVHSEMLAYLKEMNASSQSFHDLKSIPSNTSISDLSNHQENDEHLIRLALLPANAYLRFPPSLTADDAPYYPMQSSVNTTPTSLSSANTSTNMNPPFPSPKNITPKRQPKVWPILQCENVFVLPGVPKYFATKMPIIVKHFLHPLSPRRLTKKIALALEEKEIVAVLNQTVEAYPGVKFGSYPFVDNPDYKTVLTLSSSDAEILSEAYKSLLDALPQDTIVPLSYT